MGIFVAIGRFLYDLTLQYGVFGLAAGTFLESLGIPTASAVVDLTAGLLIIDGRTTFIEALIISDMGLVLGSLTSFYLGKFGAEIFERRHDHPPDEATRWAKAKDLLERHGDKSILFGQLFGPARTWISYPAGALGMDVKKFTLYTAIGGAIYCSIVITISIYLTDFIKQRFDVILSWISLPATIGVGLLLISIYVGARYLRTKNRH